MRPRIQVAEDELVEEILAEAKRILAEVGIEVRGAALRERLVDHGLQAEPDEGRILFPPEIVEAAVASAPRSFTLFDRQGRVHAELGGDRVHYVPGSSGLKVLDHREGAEHGFDDPDVQARIRSELERFVRDQLLEQTIRRSYDRTYIWPKELDIR